jgi:F0F1-type ATP synthase assembly protein I
VCASFQETLAVAAAAVAAWQFKWSLKPTAGAMASFTTHTLSLLLLVLLCYKAAAVARVVQLVAGNLQ